jgi:hypothetical protein
MIVIPFSQDKTPGEGGTSASGDGTYECIVSLLNRFIFLNSVSVSVCISMIAVLSNIPTDGVRRPPPG